MPASSGRIAPSERAFAAGDRVMFLRNERSMGVKNGTLGTLERIEGSLLTVRLDGAEGRAVSFDLKDYAAVDHGYAATIHKAQGVTVDRAHVLASAHMDRHAAYVALTRHRERLELHWAREDLTNRAGLDRALSRERAKDTTLDYQAGFAERRGILAPDSEIVVSRAVERAPTPAREGLRRGMFAGLKLGDAADRSPAETREGARERRSTFAGLRLSREASRTAEPEHVRLERAAETFGRAWADAERMRTAGLPVLPHQEQALTKAGADLDRLRPNGAEDLRVALTARPELAKDRIATTLELLARERQVGQRPEPEAAAARLVAAMERERAKR